MTNPTFTALSVILGGDTDHPINATLSSSTFTVKVPYAKKSLLSSAKLTLTASAADTYFFTSQTTGATSTVKVGTTATALTATYDISAGLEIAASAAGTLTADNHSDYDVEIVITDKIVFAESCTVGLGNSRTYSLINCTYKTDGIELPGKDILAVINASAKGGYICYYDKTTNKLLLYSAIGTQVSNNTLVDVTVFALKA